MLLSLQMEEDSPPGHRLILHTRIAFVSERVLRHSSWLWGNSVLPTWRAQFKVDWVSLAGIWRIHVGDKHEEVKFEEDMITIDGGGQGTRSRARLPF